MLTDMTKLKVAFRNLRTRLKSEMFKAFMKLDVGLACVAWSAEKVLRDIRALNVRNFK
jgi:hypothetical protein